MVSVVAQTISIGLNVRNVIFLFKYPEVVCVEDVSAALVIEKPREKCIMDSLNTILH